MWLLCSLFCIMRFKNMELLLFDSPVETDIVRRFPMSTKNLRPPAQQLHALTTQTLRLYIYTYCGPDEVKIISSLRVIVGNEKVQGSWVGDQLHLFFLSLFFPFFIVFYPLTECQSPEIGQEVSPSLPQCTSFLLSFPGIRVRDVSIGQGQTLSNTKNIFIISMI